MPLTYVKSRLRQMLLRSADEVVAALNREVIPTLAELVRRFNELGFFEATDTKTATYTADPYELVVCNPAGGAFAVTLPTGALQDVLCGGVSLSASNYVTFTAPSGETINGASTYRLQGLYAAVIFIKISSTAWVAFAEGIPQGTTDQALVWNGSAWVPTTLDSQPTVGAMVTCPVWNQATANVIASSYASLNIECGIFRVPARITFNTISWRQSAGVAGELGFGFYQNDNNDAWNGTLRLKGISTPLTPTASSANRVTLPAPVTLEQGYAMVGYAAKTGGNGSLNTFDSNGASGSSILLDAHLADQFPQEFRIAGNADAFPATIVPGDVTANSGDRLVIMRMENI